MTAEEILAGVARQHGVSVSEISGQTRLVRAIRARQEAMFRLTAETDLELEDIGRMIGGRDRSTVWHGVRVHAFRHGLVPPRGISPMTVIEKGRPKATSSLWTEADELAVAEIWTLPHGLRADAIRERLPGRSYRNCLDKARWLGIEEPEDEDARDRRKARQMCAALLDRLETYCPEMRGR